MGDTAVDARRRADDTVSRQRGPWVDQREIEEVSAALCAGALSFGPRTAEFERRFATFVGARHAIAVNSCWAGFHLAFEALGLGGSDEVLTSVAASTPAIAAITHVGARPTVVDVDAVSLTLDMAQARRKVTPWTRAIMPVHFAGCPAAMDDVLELAAQHRLSVIDDATHALPAWHGGRMIGSIGLASVFALTQDVGMTTGEGGVITTDRDDIATVFRARRFYGVPPESSPPRQPRERPRYESARTYGYGYQMADVNAAIGLGQLSKVETFHAIRTYYADLYEYGLSDLDALVLPRAPLGTRHGWARYVVRLRPECLRITRDAFIRRLAAREVAATVDFVPLYAHAYYGEQLGLRAADFANARAAYRSSLSLPISPRMTEADVWQVIHAVRAVLAEAAR